MKTKRLISILLSVLLIMTSFPVTVLADDNNDDRFTKTTEGYIICDNIEDLNLTEDDDLDGQVNIYNFVGANWFYEGETRTVKFMYYNRSHPNIADTTSINCYNKTCMQITYFRTLSFETWVEENPEYYEDYKSNGYTDESIYDDVFMTVYDEDGNEYRGTYEYYQFPFFDSVQKVIIGNNISKIESLPLNLLFKNLNCIEFEENSVLTEIAEMFGGTVYAGEDPISVAEVTLPASVTKISGGFSGSNFVSIDLSQTQITEIPDYAFYNTGNLTELKLNDKITTIGSYAFKESSIKSIELPSTLNTLGNGVFYNSSIESIDLENTEVLDIPNNAFYGAEIKTIKLNPCTETIGTSAFRLSALKEIDIPCFVNEIGGSAFRSTTDLERVTIHCNGDIDNFAFRDSGLKHLDMSDSDPTLGKQVFRGCKFEEVHLSSNPCFSITGEGTFSYCTIKTLDMPSVQTIGTNTFSNSIIENVIIPENCGKMNDCFSGADINYICIRSPYVNIYTTDYFANISNLKTIVYLNTNNFGLSNDFTGLEEYSKFMDKSIAIYGYADTPLYRHCLKNGIPFHEITEENGYPQNAQESAEENSFAIITNPDEEEPDDEEPGNNNTYPTTIGLKGTYEGGRWSAICGHSITFSGKGAIQSNIITDSNGYQYTLGEYINLANIELVYINDGITSIPEDFLYIDDETTAAVQRVVLPNDLKTIGDNAFRNTNVNVIIPRTYWCYYESLPNTNTFLNAHKCVLPEGVTSIGKYAFADTKNLTDMMVIMPKDLQVISEGLFYGSNVKSVYFPSNKATAIEKKAFAACDNLVGLTLPFTIESVYTDYVDGEENVTANAFGYLSTGGRNTRLTVSCAKLDGAVAEYCSNNNISLVMNNDYNECGTVKAGNSAGYFNWYYYEYNNSVTYEFVPRDPKIYKQDNKEDAIANYSLITNGTFDKAVVTQKINWFKGIEDLPDIGGSAYPTTKELNDGDFNVKRVNVGNGIRLIYASGVFSKFNPESINLPDTMQYMDYEIFSNCTRLKSIAIPDSVYEIGSKMFTNCSSLEYAKLSDSIDHVPPKLFYNVKSLRFVDIGEKVVRIESQAFYNCTALEEIVIPNKVEQIQNEAFYNCISAQTISIGKSVTWLGEDSFKNSVYCENITINSNSIITQDIETAFKDVGIYTNGITLTYGFGAEKIDFKLVKNLDIKKLVISKTVHNIRYVRYVPNTLETIEIDDENTTFYVRSGCLYQENCLILAPRTLRTVTIDEDATAIGTYAFADSAITKITIPDKVYFIHNYAFLNCDQLKSVKLGDGIGVIQEGAFMNCRQLRLMFFPANLYQIGDYAFKNCESLANATFVFDSENFATVGVEAFNGCKSLKCIVLPENTKRIKERAFAKCTGLEAIYIWNADVYDNAITKQAGFEIYTIAGSPAHAYARTNDITVHAFMDEDAFLEECAIKLDELAGYIGYCNGEHGNIEYLTVYEADCEHEGYAVGVCEYCWEILEEVHTPAIGHDKKVIADVPPTATTKGFKIEECKNCGETYKTEYAPTSDEVLHETHTIKGKVTVARNKNGDFTNCGVVGAKIMIDDSVAATTDDNGVFVLTLDTGTYEAEIKYAYGFTRKIYIIVEDEDITLNQPIPIIACDFNKDGVINNDDMRLFSMVISSKKDDVAYLRYVDLNNDGYINGKDQAYIRSCIDAHSKNFEYETIIMHK